MSAEASSRGLLDTSAVIDLASYEPEQLPDVPLICAITLAELSVGPLVARSSAEATARQQVLEQAESDFDALPSDAAAARAFGAVSASLRASGRKPAARTSDALIAAVAIAEGLPLFTANEADFRGIDGLEIRPLPMPAS